MLRGFLIFIAFFTRIPIGKWVKYQEEWFIKGITLYSLVGLVIGGFLVVGYFIGEFVGYSLFKGLLITGMYILITGGIHLDGASDSVDGLYSGRTGDKIFEIMSDSRVGAFGAIALIYIIVSYIILFSYVEVYDLLVMAMVGKTCVIISCYRTKYAKAQSGMGTLFVENVGGIQVAVNVVLTILVQILMPEALNRIIAAMITFVGAILIGYGVKKKINGMTGDTCGFVCEISQVIFLMMVIIFKKF